MSVRTALILSFLTAVSLYPSEDAIAQCGTSACWNHVTAPGITRADIPGDRDSLVITVRNTCPDIFSFATDPLTPVDEERQLFAPAGIADLPFDCIATDHRVLVFREEGTAGYIVTVNGPGGEPVAVNAFVPAEGSDAADVRARLAECQQEQQDGNGPASEPQDCLAGLGSVQRLETGQFVVTVNARRVFDFAGGFLGTKLVDPVYAVRDNVITRVPDAEDSYRAKVGAFVHVMPWERPVGFAVGLGGNDDALELFTGLSFRLGRFQDHAAYVILGTHLGRIETLPATEQLGAVPVSGSLAGNLPTKSDTAFFLGFSFSFLGDAETRLNEGFTRLDPPNLREAANGEQE